MEATTETCRTRRAEHTRRFPPQSFQSGTTTTAAGWRVGQDAPPGLRGWIVGLLVASGTGAVLRGQMTLRSALKTGAGLNVAGFWMTRGGQVYVPWPLVELRVTDGAGSTASTASAAFWPVFDDEPAPDGIGSVLYGFTRQNIAGGGGTATFAVDDFSTPATGVAGATGYRSLPAGSSASTFVVEELAASVVWGRYVLDGNAASTPGVAQGGWLPTPPAPSGQIRVTNNDAAAKDFAVHWKFDLGQLR